MVDAVASGVVRPDRSPGELGLEIAGGLDHFDGGIDVLEHAKHLAVDLEMAAEDALDGADVALGQAFPCGIRPRHLVAMVDGGGVVDAVRVGATAPLEADEVVVGLRESLVGLDGEDEVPVEVDPPVGADLGEAVVLVESVAPGGDPVFRRKRTGHVPPEGDRGRKHSGVAGPDQLFTFPSTTRTKPMETDHRIVVGDARELSAIAAESVELVVTSPPYPMVEMWDSVFAELDPVVAEHLDAGDGVGAFERMHDVLGSVWTELDRVLVDGGIACINVGDATRTLDGQFRVYQNHARIIEALESLGFEPLPEILWRKPANSAAKFMGSGMLPPNAYVTLEHEYVLPFRKGGSTRTFEPHAERRYEAAYFWEERNRWFSDVWTDVRGEHQPLDHEALRDRSGAFPFAVPYRLINMFSVYGDTVLDPFWGTGTTSLAAMVAGRGSIGIERESHFTEVFRDRVDGVADLSGRVVRSRIADHLAFVNRVQQDGEALAYEATHYPFPVRTKQARDIRFYRVDRVDRVDSGYRVTHEPVDASFVNQLVETESVQRP